MFDSRFRTDNGALDFLNNYLLGLYPPAPTVPNHSPLGLFASGMGLNAFSSIPTPQQWLYVTRRFQRFLSEIEPTAGQHEDVETKAIGIISCLNREYWEGQLREGLTSFVLAGSWAKGTRIRPHSDMDLIFLLPWAVYRRFENRAGNKQSGILQEIKEVLLRSYPNTDIRSDGPTVIVNFTTYKVEIAPTFIERSSTTYIYDPSFKVVLCDTNDGGRYKLAAPSAEVQKVLGCNTDWKGDLIALIRMAKIWKSYCNVPIKSFCLEQLGLEFLAQWHCVRLGVFWYDWMMRDFFRFMLSRQNGWGTLPVSNELFFYGNAWVSRAETALKNSSSACWYEQYSLNELAGEEWQKVFGSRIPQAA
jgi:hypothetical protein